jgi:phosphoribosylformylglycinamidine synthase
MNKNETNGVRVLIICGFGLNCERETEAAFRLCGADPQRVHLNDLLAGKRKLDEFQILAFIGGFSFGDHLGAGTVFANRVKHGLRSDLERFVRDGKLIIGICNGFQTLTRMGLLPALDGNLFDPKVALIHNDSGLFRDDWVHMKANPDSPCIFTKGLDRFRLPIRHGEGKLVANPDILERIENENLVALRYADADGNVRPEFPINPNGSLNNIAGICSPNGRIFGLMPHPEAFLSPCNAPDWIRENQAGRLPSEGEGVAIFRNAVEFAAANR